MTYRKTFAVALAAAFIGLCLPTCPMSAQVKNRNDLKLENAQLRTQLDSLKAEICKYQQELKRTDSMVNEILSLYEQESRQEAETRNETEYTAEVSDSLLSVWYLQKLIAEENPDMTGMDTVQFASNVPDSVYIERIRRMNSFITLPYNDIVRGYIVKYSEKMPQAMSRILGLCEYYMPIFEETFNRYDMPEELKAMAVIESAMNPQAVSRAGAKGMWQFMYQTGKLYNLHIDSFVDERLDPVKSADAAARYLMDAYEIFGDWNLAIASYNCGAGNVNKAIRRSGRRAFWDIWPFLPRETRGYVPAVVGALYTLKYHKEHGIKPLDAARPVHVDTFRIHQMLHLKQVSELTGAPLDQLKNLNPQYRHEIIPGNEREYILRIPFQYSNAFIDMEDSLAVHKADIYFNPVTIKKIKDGGDGERILYKVRSGDYLGKIAEKYRVSVSQIKRWNNLKSNNIRVGQRLVIYRGGRAPASTAAAPSKPAPKPVVVASGEYVIYTIQSGDSFYSIAKNYPGISAQNIMDYNRIRPGMKIKIPLKM